MDHVAPYHGTPADPLIEEAGSPQPSPAPAVFFKLRAHGCCVGVDLPGLGHAHAPDCAAMRRASEIRIQEVAGGSGPTPAIQLADLYLAEIRAAQKWDAQRDRLVAQLIFAARDLAEDNLLPPRHTREVMVVQATWCRECQMTEHLGQLQHGMTCHTGRVLEIIEKLCANAALNSNDKEAVEGEETGSAGDRIRLRGLTDLACDTLGTATEGGAR